MEHFTDLGYVGLFMAAFLAATVLPLSSEVVLSGLLLSGWLGLSEATFTNAEKRFKQYGLVALLFAWVPIIGDPLTVMAGILRTRLLWFIILVTTGKLARYIAVSYFTLQTV